jgi:hypothetical protein
VRGAGSSFPRGFVQADCDLQQPTRPDKGRSITRP